MNQATDPMAITPARTWADACKMQIFSKATKKRERERERKKEIEIEIEIEMEIEIDREIER